MRKDDERMTDDKKPEPVAFVPIHPRNGILWSMTTPTPDPEQLPHYSRISLYTEPPARKWVGLTDEEISNIMLNLTPERQSMRQMFRIVEAALKAKNT